MRALGITGVEPLRLGPRPPSGVTALSGLIFISSPLILTSSSASAAALVDTSASRRSQQGAALGPDQSAAVAGAATGNGPAARMAVNNARGMSWILDGAPSPTAFDLQMSPARSQSRSASNVAAFPNATLRAAECWWSPGPPHARAHAGS